MRAAKILLRRVAITFAFAGCLVAALPVGNALAIAPPPPERTGIIFENGGRIVSMEADGSGRQVLTRKNQRPLPYPWDFSHDSDPEVSGNGESILFLRHQFGKDREQIVVADREGKGQRVVFTSNISPSRSEWVDLISPVFRPDDGIMVVRSALIEGKWGNYSQDSIISMNRNGRNRKTIRWKKHAQIMSIDLSPNGKKLLVSGYSPRERQQIEVLDLASGRNHIIRKGGDEARWSPDGRQIVFTSDHQRIGEDCDYMDGCNYDQRIYLMNSDGSGVHRLIKGKARGFQLGPDFSADGGRIAFYSDRNTGPLEMNSSEIYSVGVDGSCLTWLTNGSPSSTEPVWAPDEGTSWPRSCDGADRAPLVESRPLASTPYWLGKVFRTSMFETDGGKGRGFELDPKDPLGFKETGMLYTGCTQYSPKDCEDVDYTLGYAGVCRKWPEEMLDRGQFGSLTERKGTLVMWPREFSFMGETFLPEVLVLAGSTQLSLNAVLPEDPRKVASEMIGSIRPTGSTKPVRTFPSPVINRSLLRKAGRIHRAVEHDVGRSRISERFAVGVKAVSSWSRFHEQLETMRKSVPVHTKACPQDD